MSLLLSTISKLFESLSTWDLSPPDLSVKCHVDKCRCEADPRADFATGTLTSSLATEFGTIVICIRWTAEGQSLTEHGWIVRESPHLKGAYVQAALPIFSEEGPLEADSDELEALAYDFWSYRDICEIVLQALPSRSEPRMLSAGRHYGVNGLAHAGHCRTSNNDRRSGVVYPSLNFWLQA